MFCTEVIGEEQFRRLNEALLLAEQFFRESVQNLQSQLAAGFKEYVVDRPLAASWIIPLGIGDRTRTSWCNACLELADGQPRFVRDGVMFVVFGILWLLQPDVMLRRIVRQAPELADDGSAQVVARIIGAVMVGVSLFVLSRL